MARQDKKTQLVLNYLNDFLEKNKFSSNNKIPSEHTLANNLKVSRSTVRQALDNLQNLGLIYKIQGCGAFFDQNKLIQHKLPINSDNGHRIALILQGQDHSANSELELGVKSIFDKKQISYKTYYTDNKFVNEYNCIKNLMYADFDGFIIDGVKASLLNPNLSLYQTCYNELNIPMIFYNNYYKELSYPKVLVDGRYASFKLCSDLIAKGHSKIAGIFVCDNYQAVEKFHGMYEAMLKHDIVLYDNYIKWCVSDVAHDIAFIKGIKKFIESVVDCTALVCCNSIIYKLVKQALAELGMVIGKDISVVAMDITKADLKNDNIYCTIDQSYTIGKIVACNLIDMIESLDFKGRLSQYSHILPAIIHEGSSVCKI